LSRSGSASAGYQNFSLSLPPRFVRLGFIAYQKGKVSRARLAEYLETSLFDLKTVLLEYGFDKDVEYEIKTQIVKANIIMKRNYCFLRETI